MKLLEYNITLPTDFYLKDISMLSYVVPSEFLPLKVEKDFFEANPNLGELIHWAPVIGDLFVNANDFGSDIRKIIVESEIWDVVDKMHERVDFLKEFLDNND